MATAPAVHAAFDRFEKLLPSYVSPRRAILVSLAITAVVMAVLYPIVLREVRAQLPHKRAARDTTTLILSVVGFLLLRVLYDRIYFLDVFKENKLHFGILPWVAEYSRAFRG